MKKNRNIFFLCIIDFLQGLVFYGPVAILYRQSRGISLNDIFIIETIFVILIFLFEVPWGYIADKIGYKKTLVISYFMLFFSQVIFYLAHSFQGFLLQRSILAISSAGISGCDSALIYSSVEDKDSNKAFGYYNAAGTAGYFIASLGSSLIVSHSLDLTVLFTIIPYCISFFLSFFLLNTNVKVEKEEQIGFIDSFKSLRANKSIFIFVISVALISESTHSVCVFLNQPMYLRSGISMKYFGLISAFMQVACLLSARAYKMNEKVGTKKLYIVLISMIIVANIVLIYIKSWILVVAMIFLIEGAFAITQPLSSTIQNRSINSPNRATLLSTYAMIGDVFASFSNLVVGKASDYSLNTAIGACAVLNILAFMLILIFFQKKDRKENKNTGDFGC